ncbi:MAG: ABC transporter ATP-binding protein [Deltaproteobacteria bacterium]|jgi:branched-chain amino acid transport system ATP-binding protein|nr:ABC transporter ATP-binding protein [Deltaproteobacteria bacterium]
MLKIKDLDIFYGQAQVAFKTSLAVKEGEFVGIFGRNGAGKTSLFRALMGLRPPAAKGDITFKGRNVQGLPPHEIANLGIGWVPEDRKIFPNLTIRRNLLLGEKAEKHLSKGKRRFKLDDAYRFFPKLHELRDKLGSQLSGGEQQMLTVARTMMGNPDLLLLDEPTEGLAPNITKDVLKMILEIRADFQVTTIVVEQFSEALLQHLDRCCVMEMGECIFDDRPSALQNDEELKRRLLGVG